MSQPTTSKSTNETLAGSSSSVSLHASSNITGTNSNTNLGNSTTSSDFPTRQHSAQYSTTPARLPSSPSSSSTSFLNKLVEIPRSFLGDEAERDEKRESKGRDKVEKEKAEKSEKAEKVEKNKSEKEKWDFSFTFRDKWDQKDRDKKERERLREDASSDSTATATTTTTATGSLPKERTMDLSQSYKEAKSEKDKEAPVFDEDTVADIIAGMGVTIHKKNWDNSSAELSLTDYNYWFQFKVRREDYPLLKFKDFAPKVFAQIRAHFGITDEAYLSAFQSANIKPSKGEGKSGAFFIFTKCKQFILKTATMEERDFLWQMLPEYWNYLLKNPDTLLPRYYGVYSMKHEGPGGVTRFLVMNNLFNTPYEPVEIYDLKGSTLGRFTTPKQRSQGGILKDLDIKNDKRKLFLDEELARKFARSLKKDTNFLAEHNVMDYSLLLGIHYETPQNAQKTKDNLERLEQSKLILNHRPNIFQLDCNGKKCTKPDGTTETYYVGIIDILVQYENFKRAENMLKKVVYYKEEASVIHPKHYATRLFSFVCDPVTGILNKLNDEGLYDEEPPVQVTPINTNTNDTIAEGEKVDPSGLSNSNKKRWSY